MGRISRNGPGSDREYAVKIQSCAYQYAEEAIEEERFEFLFVYCGRYTGVAR